MDIEKANKAIRNAWIAGIVSGGITLILALISVALGRDITGLGLSLLSVI